MQFTIEIEVIARICEENKRKKRERKEEGRRKSERLKQKKEQTKKKRRKEESCTQKNLWESCRAGAVDFHTKNRARPLES